MLSSLRDGGNFKINFKIWMYKAIKKMIRTVIERRIGGHLYQFRKLEESYHSLLNEEADNKKFLEYLLRNGASKKKLISEKIRVDNEIMDKWIFILGWFDWNHGGQYMNPKSSEAQELGNLFFTTGSEVDDRDDYGALRLARMRTPPYFRRV